MSLTIPPEFERAVRERVDSGANESTDDVLRACLEALTLLEADMADENEWLRREVRIGIDEADRGELIPRDEAIASMRAELKRRIGRWVNTPSPGRFDGRRSMPRLTSRNKPEMPPPPRPCWNSFSPPST